MIAVAPPAPVGIENRRSLAGLFQLRPVSVGLTLMKLTLPARSPLSLNVAVPPLSPPTPGTVPGLQLPARFQLPTIVVWLLVVKNPPSQLIFDASMPACGWMTAPV